MYVNSCNAYMVLWSAMEAFISQITMVIHFNALKTKILDTMSNLTKRYKRIQ